MSFQRRAHHSGINAGPSIPDAKPVRVALREHDALAQLTERLAASKRRLSEISAVLPAPLRPFVSAGPLDELGWSLFAENAAVAAKLRQLLPRIEERLAQAGLPGVKVRIKLCRRA